MTSLRERTNLLKQKVEELEEELRVARKGLAEKLELEMSIWVNQADRYTECQVQYRLRATEKAQLRSDSAVVQAMIDGIAHAIREDFGDKR